MNNFLSLILLIAIGFSFTSCGDDEASPSIITEQNYSLFSGTSTEVKGESLKNIKWRGDNYVAEVDEQGFVHANKIGYTMIYASGIASASNYPAIRVVVKPNNTYYSEPLLYANSTFERISYKGGYLQFDPAQTSRMPLSDIWNHYYSFLPTYIANVGLPWTVYKRTSDYVMYKTDKSASPYVAYILDKEGKIIGAGVYVNPNFCSELPAFLNERYVVYNVDMTSYTADFAHAVSNSEGTEVTVDYLGAMAYSKQSGMIILSYAEGSTKSRAASQTIMDVLKGIEM